MAAAIVQRIARPVLRPCFDPSIPELRGRASIVMAPQMSLVRIAVWTNTIKASWYRRRAVTCTLIVAF
jgi:hypothetical protein